MIVLIAAMGENRIIGVGGELPWHLPRDLARFKQLTMGRPLIMGRRTFDSIGRPLPGRPNIVVTRNRQFAPPGVDVTTSPGEALLKAMRYEADEMFVIGGDEIYRQFLPSPSESNCQSFTIRLRETPPFPSYSATSGSWRRSRLRRESRR